MGTYKHEEQPVAVGGPAGSLLTRATPSGGGGSGGSGANGAFYNGGAGMSYPPPLQAASQAQQEFENFAPNYPETPRDTAPPLGVITVNPNPFHPLPQIPMMTGQTDDSDSYPVYADLSSFDASTSRAPAGYRGTPTTYHSGGGWAAEEGDDIARTWEEGQERRRRAEQELQRRREIAQKEEEEKRLGEEFWKGEEERFGPVAPEKIRPHSTGAEGVGMRIPMMAGSLGFVSSAPGPGQHQLPSSAPAFDHHFMNNPFPQAPFPTQSVSPLQSGDSGFQYQEPVLMRHEQQQQQQQQQNLPPSPPVHHQQASSPPPPPPPQQIRPPPSPPPIAPESHQHLLDLQDHSQITSQTPSPPPQPAAPAPESTSTPAAPTPTPPPPPPRPDRSSETFPIKHINWVDPYTHQMRRSPILLQNGNGPCPLLALVNALVLSTPQGIMTSLLEILQVREHVSLGLLLDAVFDGVVSRASTHGEEIDVGELFSFLMGLSTGMNVNPAFVSTGGSEGGGGDRAHPPPPPSLGEFEHTKEMRLYNSFKIPLYHGWLPHPQSRVYEVLQRIAPNYEMVQNALLGEEDVLLRISTAEEGDVQAARVSEEEGRLIEDVAVVREWLEDTRTQLTEWGLKRLTEEEWGSSAVGGQGGAPRIGILFRNDHFLTVMKAWLPLEGERGMQGAKRPVLLALVTDMGYGGYEEVVWESLVSIRGEGGQFLTGDLRPVGEGGGGHGGGGGDSGQERARRPIQSMLDVGDDDDEGWRRVQRRHGNQRQGQGQGHPQRIPQHQPAPPPPQHHRPQSQSQSQSNNWSFVDSIFGRSSNHNVNNSRPPPPQNNTHSHTHTHPNHAPNALPNSQIPPPMLPPRTSSTRMQSDIQPQIDLSRLRVNVVEPPPGEGSTDYDLALAMQLQEEEDERERQRVLSEVAIGATGTGRRASVATSTGGSRPQMQPHTPRRPAPPQQLGVQGRRAVDEVTVPAAGPVLPGSGGEDVDAPPPPYEQHTSHARPSPAAVPAPASAPAQATPLPPAGSRQSVPNFPVFGGGGGGGGAAGGVGAAGDSLGRRRSEAVMRRGQEARRLLNEFPGAPGGGGVPGGQQGGGGGASGGGSGGGGSLKEGGGAGKKDCVVM